MKFSVLTLSIACTFSAATVFAQPQGISDPAMIHNRLLKEQSSEGAYKLIGTFKVTGSPYLFGEKNKGDLYSQEATAKNVFLSYNTYNQEVEFFSSGNPDKPLVKEPGHVDSFTLSENATLGINKPIKFIYGGLLGTSEKAFFKEIYKGPRFSVYKRYKSELGYVSSNYTQTELRQFDLIYDFFYSDSQEPGLKKLKNNAGSIIKEFKKIRDISPAFDPSAFTINQEAELEKAFIYLNQ